MHICSKTEGGIPIDCVGCCFELSKTSAAAGQPLSDPWKYRMKYLLFVYLFAATTCSEAVNDGYSCVTNYWLTITCVMNITEEPVEQTETKYWLEFNWDYALDYSCLHMMMNQSYSCTFAAQNGIDTFIDEDIFDISLCQKSGCRTVIHAFKPSQNIQLTPPHDVAVQRTPEDFNITWKSGYENHSYLQNEIRYELSLQASHSISNKTFKLISERKYTSIGRSRLEPDISYCIVVRSHPVSSAYGAIWSTWSQPACWRTEARKEQENILIILTKSMVPMCLAVGFLLFLFYSPAARMKIKTLSHTPSPAHFLPLFQQHEGNLKEWLSPQGSVILEYKTEEIMTGAITIVPKPIAKDPKEEDQNSSVTQIFPQCQTSYVGLPGMDMASLPLTGVCPGDTSYTQLPCSTWGLGVVEASVLASSPEDFLDTSCADSGCSCEDLTQSPERSLPNSPLHASPPLCYCEDYCILNKTPSGVIPVLLSKESRNVPSASLQDNENEKSQIIGFTETEMQ
ncbi:hypothetical protein LDENG_00022050 [Lucifuga dentata]|nr:hypothetical protein LDENG_00022050 [Lucifuga dentata]